MNLSNEQIKLLKHISELGCDEVWCSGDMGIHKGTPCPFSREGETCIAYGGGGLYGYAIKRQARELLYRLRQGVIMTPEGVKNYEAQAAWDAARQAVKVAEEALEAAEDALGEAQETREEAQAKEFMAWQALIASREVAWEVAWEEARRSGGGGEQDAGN